MPWTLCTSGSAITKAGANVSTTITNYGTQKTAMDKFSDEAEGYIVQQTHIDWRADYSNLAADIQNALSNVCSSLVAIQFITYDMSGYTRLGEAVTMLNIHDQVARDGVVFLKDFKKATIRSAD